MSISLRQKQLDAVVKMKNGCILCGDPGSGKSRTALSYYYLTQGGDMMSLIDDNDYIPMHDPCKDLYIITTAKKRDDCEWEGELAPFLLSTHQDVNQYDNAVTVDSWNNIKKYNDVSGAFFIFDEQRVIGHGVWVKSFLRITENNEWILLSATPGDTWMDYIPVFIANGFYKNRTQFIREHVVYKQFSKYPVIETYLNEGRLIRLRNKIIVYMDVPRETVQHHETVYVSYDRNLYKEICRKRWDVWNNKPIVNASEFCYLLRKAVNSDQSRITAVLEIFEKHPKVIIFYNFDYELEMLKGAYYGEDVEISEWNGHKHQPLPDGNDSWVYLVQYAAGCEGWNCIRTDTIIFFSQNYSYKVLEQASGRIDRLNTPFRDLYYYHLKSRSGIDIAIGKALDDKKKFNEGMFMKGV